MLVLLIVGTALLAVAPPTPATDAEPASLAEYNVRRDKIPKTAEAHWKLGLWCEQKGLKGEATIEFLAVVELDPRRDAAWKKLGYEKSNGRWMSARQLAAERAEIQALRKAESTWRPRLQRWKGWLSQKTRRDEAEKALAEVTDPLAVPSVWRVFVQGDAEDQERAIDILGHIDGERSSRALAGLAIFGRSPQVRRAAVETLTHRKTDDPFMLWIGELEKPLGYEVRRVGGPGSPGVLFVEGERFNVRRLYSPPSVDQIQGGWVDLPETKFVTGIQLDSSPPGPPPGSRCIGAVDGTALYIYDYHWALPSPPKQGPDPSSLYQMAEMRQLQTQENLNFELEEAEKMAAGAQAQLEHDISTIENTNATIRERNDRLVTALRRISGKKFGPDREDWLKWWTERRGYEYVPPQKQPKPVVDVQVPLPYVPQGGPRQFVPGAGGGGGGFKWCLVYEKQKDKKPNTGQCFAAGTIVLTPRGPRPIETLRPGDTLLSRAEPDGPTSTDTVEAVSENPSVATLRLTLGGESLVTTAGHPFYDPALGWTCAGDLKPGNVVLTQHDQARIEAITPGPASPVWNLRLKAGTSYLVGRQGLVAHDLSPLLRNPVLKEKPGFGTRASGRRLSEGSPWTSSGR